MAELVSTVTGDGVRLDGLLSRGAPIGDSGPSVDLFICHHGVGANFYDPRLYGPLLGELLLAAGCDVLRVNNRGHDLVYSQPESASEALRRTRGRLGAAFEIVDDCCHDWKAWNDFASAAGYHRIGLWGHSLGAVKTVHFLAAGLDERVCLAIASSPPRFCHEQMREAAGGAEFMRDYSRAQTLQASGEPDALLSVTVPTSNDFSARTFTNKYGPENRYDFVTRLSKVRTPLLITLGGLERDSSYHTLAQTGDTLVKQIPGAGFALIPGANHWYSGRTGELWAAARTWIAGIGPAPEQASKPESTAEKTK